MDTRSRCPTEKAGVSRYLNGRTGPEEVVECGKYGSHIKYKVGGDNYDFYIGIEKPGYYESLRMTDKGLKKSVDKIQEAGFFRICGSAYAFQYDEDTGEVVNKTQMLAHLFDMAAEETVMEQLNESKIPDGLKSAFKSSNSPLSGTAVVAQTGAENYWYIRDGIEMYAVWKNEDQLSVWSCCKRVDVLAQNTESEELGMCSYLVKGPVIYQFRCYGNDMIYDDMVEIYFDPMLRSFQPIVEIT